MRLKKTLFISIFTFVFLFITNECFSRHWPWQIKEITFEKDNKSDKNNINKASQYKKNKKQNNNKTPQKPKQTNINDNKINSVEKNIKNIANIEEQKHQTKNNNNNQNEKLNEKNIKERDETKKHITVIHEQMNKPNYYYFNETTMKTIRKYIVTEKNPIFDDKKHMIGLSYGYDYDRLHHNDHYGRNLHVAYIHYAFPFQMFNIHARMSFGFFILGGRDKAAINAGEGLYHHVGAELIQEAILGNKFLYVTAGFGTSYVFMGGKMTYLSHHQAQSSGIPNSAKGYDGMTYFNWILRASIGHRFDNGFALEIMWTHYSNGGLGEVNYDINAFGITLLQVFNI